MKSDNLRKKPCRNIASQHWQMACKTPPHFWDTKYVLFKTSLLLGASSQYNGCETKLGLLPSNLFKLFRQKRPNRAILPISKSWSLLRLFSVLWQAWRYLMLKKPETLSRDIHVEKTGVLRGGHFICRRSICKFYYQNFAWRHMTPIQLCNRLLGHNLGLKCHKSTPPWFSIVVPQDV